MPNTEQQLIMNKIGIKILEKTICNIINPFK